MYTNTSTDRIAVVICQYKITIHTPYNEQLLNSFTYLEIFQNPLVIFENIYLKQSSNDS